MKVLTPCTGSFGWLASGQAGRYVILNLLQIKILNYPLQVNHYHNDTITFKLGSSSNTSYYTMDICLLPHTVHCFCFTAEKFHDTFLSFPEKLLQLPFTLPILGKLDSNIYGKTFAT